MYKIAHILIGLSLLIFSGTAKSNEKPNFWDIMQKINEELQKEENNGNKTIKNKFVADIQCSSDGYMKIIGDLCWDKFLYRSSWNKRFPGCDFTYKYGTVKKNGEMYNCYSFIQGKEVTIDSVKFKYSTASPSGLIVEEIEIDFSDNSYERSLVDYIKSNFDYNFDRTISNPISNVNNSYYCSLYTCYEILEWNSGDSLGSIEPSDYTLSIFDRQRINPGTF